MPKKAKNGVYCGGFAILRGSTQESRLLHNKLTKITQNKLNFNLFSLKVTKNGYFFLILKIFSSFYT